jgi:hypothetical protein
MSNGSSGQQQYTQQTVSSQNEPYAGAKPLIDKVLGDAKSSYESGGFDFNPFPNSTVVPNSNQTNQATDLFTQIGRQGSQPFTNAFNSVNQVVEGGGMTDPQRANLQNLIQMGDGSYRPEGAAGVQQQLNTVSGNYFGANPELQNYIGQINDETSLRVNEMFGDAGRYGSGLHQKVLGDTIADNTSRVMMNDYNMERGNQVQAGRDLIAGSQAQDGLASGIGFGVNDAFRGASGDMVNAAASLPQFYSAQAMPGDMLLRAGGIIEDQQGREMQDAIDRYYADQSSAYERIARGMGIASGGGQMGGSRQQTILSPAARQPSTFERILGGASTAAGIAGSFF